MTAATLRPLSFMKVFGFSRKKSWPPTSTRVVQPLNFDSFDQWAFVAPAMESTHQKPALWRVSWYSRPGLPRPTMSRISSMKKRRPPFAAGVPLLEELSGEDSSAPTIASIFGLPLLLFLFFLFFLAGRGLGFLAASRRGR